mmetsp:Transcript_26957/g.64723  ORF Transcript_26957/g.64723 Transcript_26957/m.64723 type:complete len:221 (-) Transcript_26957:345-1007(-)
MTLRRHGGRTMRGSCCTRHLGTGRNPPVRDEGRTPRLTTIRPPRGWPPSIILWHVRTMIMAFLFPRISIAIMASSPPPWRRGSTASNCSRARYRRSTGRNRRPVPGRGRRTARPQERRPTSIARGRWHTRDATTPSRTMGTTLLGWYNNREMPVVTNRWTLRRRRRIRRARRPAEEEEEARERRRIRPRGRRLRRSRRLCPEGPRTTRCCPYFRSPRSRI